MTVEGFSEELLAGLSRDGDPVRIPGAGGYSANLDVDALALQPLATGYAVLTQEEMDLGVAAPADPAGLELPDGDRVPVLDPLADGRRVSPGTSGPADAAGALAALDLGLDLEDATP